MAGSDPAPAADRSPAGRAAGDPAAFRADPRPEPPAGAPRAPARRGQNRAILLSLAGVPLILMVVAAWGAWRATWREANFELAHTAEASAEYALRVLSAYAVAAGRVDTILRGLSDAEIRAREQALHRELRDLVAELPQAEAAFVVDREGRALVAANLYPVPRDVAPAADRDFFLALKGEDPPATHVSQVHVGRFDGRPFFAVSRRRTRTGNAGIGPRDFDGLVNLSVYPDWIAARLSHQVSDPGDLLAILRNDGEVLAESRAAGAPRGILADPGFARLLATGAERGRFESVLAGDAGRWLVAARRVEGWPVRVIAARPESAIIGAWRRAVAAQLLLAVPASGVLLGLALMLLRAQDRLALANAGLERRVAARTAALAESEARLRDALEAGRVFAFEWDAASDTIHRSPNAAAILGLPQDQALAEQRAAALAAVHPDDLAACRAVLPGLRPAAPGYALRYRYCRADGGPRWLSEQGRARFAADGRLLGITGLVRDMTPEAAAEQALRAGEARMRELLATLDLGAAMVRDPDGTIRFWSKGCELLYGWTAAEALGRRSQELLRTGYPVPMAAIEASLAETEEWSGDLTKTTRDGRAVIVSVRMALRRGGAGGRDAVLEMMDDVTAHRAAEAALAGREAEFRAIFEGSLVGMAQADPATGRLLRVNRRLCEMTGRAEAALTAGLALADLLPPETRGEVEAGLARALGNGGRYDAELRLLRGDGAEIWVLLQAAPANGGGEADRAILVVQDITERRRAEEQRALMTRELDHRAKNALAVVQAALRLTPKDDAVAYALAVEGRVSALARAHTLLAQGRWEGAALRALLEAEMATFLPAGLPAGLPPGADLPQSRVSAEGPEILLAPAAVQAVSMALHELATNATKYGALSVPGGSVAVRWQVDPRAGLLRLAWTERGGPPVAAPPERRGFGSRVIEATLRDQLGGSVSRRWDATGLVCEMELPLARVAGNRLAAA
jgi:PAS domain S-box-containing protein